MGLGLNEVLVPDEVYKAGKSISRVEVGRCG